ncbi:MAG: hypothetical protein AAB331_03000, partial [Planctomycetota bacterium]
SFLNLTPMGEILPLRDFKIDQQQLPTACAAGSPCRGIMRNLLLKWFWMLLNFRCRSIIM